jgi:hypothetical protein
MATWTGFAELLRASGSMYYRPTQDAPILDALSRGVCQLLDTLRGGACRDGSANSPQVTYLDPSRTAAMPGSTCVGGE